MSVRAVSLDLDDTLIRSEALKRKVLLDIAGEFEGGLKVMSGVNTDARVSGVKCTRHTIFRDFALGLHASTDLSESALAKLKAGPAPEALGKQLAARYTELVDATLKDAEEVPGAQHVLQYLSQQGLPVYINSATPQDALNMLLQQRAWTPPLVVRAFGSPALGGDKVDNLTAIAAHAGLAASELVHVGDGDNDASAAQRFGCKFIRLAEQPRSASTEELVARDMHEVGELICGMAKLPHPSLSDKLDSSRKRPSAAEGDEISSKRPALGNPAAPNLKAGDQRPACRICEKNAAPEKLPYGGVIWQDDRWLLCHASPPPGVAGWCMLHTKRHIVGPAEFDSVEAAQFGVLLQRLQSGLLKATGAKRVYFAAMSETIPHFHMHLVPREYDLPAAAAGGGFALFGLEKRAKAGGSDAEFRPVDTETVNRVVAELRRDLEELPVFGRSAAVPQ